MVPALVLYKILEIRIYPQKNPNSQNVRFLPTCSISANLSFSTISQG